jgi:hypothetical protein
MTEAMEKRIDSYYEDSIELADRKFLRFKRIVEYRCTNRRAVKIAIEDLETETTVDLATYFDAKWTFSSPMSESIFWRTVKENMAEFKEVFNRLRESVPSSKEFHMYQIRMGKFASRTSSSLDKLTTLFKSELNEPNV